MNEKIKIKDKALNFYQQHELKLTIGFFLAGFLFDVFTLSDPDDIFSIIQQLIYLLIIGYILISTPLIESDKITLNPLLNKLWTYQSLIVHFLLGSLLSIYALFFFKSSSIVSSFIFLIILFGLMIANETQKVQQSAIWIKISLWTLCMISFFSILVPTIIGSVGYLSFFLTIILTGGVLSGVFFILKKYTDIFKNLLKKILLPQIVTLTVFIVFYFLGWIPPVPVSTKFLGIYHNIEKYEDQYHLFHYNPFWKFWNNGDQNFYSSPGDKIFVFMNVYSPSRFSDDVVVHWLFKDPKQGWITSDKINMKITGGREDGFRGYTSKSNYMPGEWRVQVETRDSREIGRIYFEVFNNDGTKNLNLEKDIR